jgi:hypothetical protein
MTSPLSLTLYLLSDVVRFASLASGLQLRTYQQEVARAIVNSVINDLGLTFVVIFPRQSGKNELQAQIETYLLVYYASQDRDIIKVSPTWRPQSLNALRRLKAVLDKNCYTFNRYQLHSGFIFRFDTSRITFLSGKPEAHVLGATASLLLECDEAQQLLVAKWDKDFAPMAASTNATRVFWGTMWTSQTLLARELRTARHAEALDGHRRVFILSADQVSAEVPAYGTFVAEQVARLGHHHPLVKTQYFSEEIDAETGMFPPERQALMKGHHPRLVAPLPGEIYALLLDLAGEDEAASGDLDLASPQALRNPSRDSTALTVVRVDLSSLSDDLIQAPSYQVVNRYLWTGVRHTTLYGCIKALAGLWRARYLVVDATGVGAGLASFLHKALPGRVLPFIFSSSSKSDLGWRFLALVETGRYKEYAPLSPSPVPGAGCHRVGEENDNQSPDLLQSLFWDQVQHCQSTVLVGPNKAIRWGVLPGSRHPITGEILHDDLLISASLCALLDDCHWGTALSGLIPSPDPLQDMSDAY